MTAFDDFKRAFTLGMVKALAEAIDAYPECGERDAAAKWHAYAKNELERGELLAARNGVRLGFHCLSQGGES